MKTILLIEDNAGIRENMGEILELAKYKVLLAEDGRQGIAMALAGKPDLIVCDIMMPGLDGYGVLHLLHKHDDMRHTPFIFITALAERSEMRRGMDLGADDYITKPFTGTELLNAIEGRLQKVVPALSDDDAAAGQTRPAEEKEEEGRPVSVAQVFDAEQDTQLYHKKQLIYTEGHRAFRLYQVLGGKVKIFKTNDEGKELIVAICGAGDYFGYNALLEGAAAGESAEALEEATEVASISRAAFQSLIESPAVARQFIRLLAGNVREKETQLLGLAYNSLRKKVAEALIMLHHKFESKEGDDAPAFINISRENMAALAGTAKESLIRTLGDFRNEGLIALSGSHITILEHRKLSRLIN